MRAPRKRVLDKHQIVDFVNYLSEEERGDGTIEKYQRDVTAFAAWLGERPAEKDSVTDWKSYLLTCGYAPRTINSMLGALNKFFTFVGWDDCRTKYLRVQRQMFCSEERELTQMEYIKLLNTARQAGRERLALLMETICATGIRVSEVPYITVEAALHKKAQIALKGKIRTILLPGKLCKKLLHYAKKQKIASGKIFLTKSGNGLNRKQIWAEMKGLCKQAGIVATKVFPHNLRHLFARMFYGVSRDVAKLADVLGHSSIETTRIYLISSGAEHEIQLERLGLIC